MVSQKRLGTKKSKGGSTAPPERMASRVVGEEAGRDHRQKNSQTIGNGIKSGERRKCLNGATAAGLTKSAGRRGCSRKECIEKD